MRQQTSQKNTTFSFFLIIPIAIDPVLAKYLKLLLNSFCPPPNLATLLHVARLVEVEHVAS